MADLPEEGPFVGSRCAAGPGQSWGPVTIRSVHADGTCTVEFDTKDMVVMPYWYGVPPSELSFDDAGRWPAVFAELSPGGAAVGVDGFIAILRRLGYDAPEEAIHEFWGAGCSDALTVPTGEIKTFRADAMAVYALFLRLRQCAKSVADILHPPTAPPLVKQYWNQTRMGGRDPDELPRPVTLADAFAAMGVDAGREARKEAKAVREYEAKHGIVLPDTLRVFATRAGVGDAVKDCHPNNPLFSPLKDGWELHRGLRARQPVGDFGVTVVTEYQGAHEWVAVFDSGDADARVYLRAAADDDVYWALTAPSLPLFFWDLAQTGLGWYQDTKFQGGKPVATTDIGYVPK